jgi:hypothetical protein
MNQWLCQCFLENNDPQPHNRIFGSEPNPMNDKPIKHKAVQIRAAQTHLNWKDALADMFSCFEKQELSNSANDEIGLMGVAMISYEAIRNSYPEVHPDDVAFETATQLWFALSVSRLINDGKLERVIDSNGKISYRRTR